MAANWKPVGEPQPIAGQRSYDTELSPEEERGYRQWMDRIGHTRERGYRVDQDYTGADYDYRGFFRKHGDIDLAQGQHLTDEFKKPAHETFSNESRYATGEDAARAGRWEGEKYIPPQSQGSAASRWKPVGEPQPLKNAIYVAGARRTQPRSDLARARPQPEERPGVVSTLARGVGERIGSLAGGLAVTAGKAGDFVARTGIPAGPLGVTNMVQALGDEVLDRPQVPRPGVVPLPEAGQNIVRKQSDLLKGVGGEMTREGRLGYQPMTTTEDIKTAWKQGDHLNAASEAVKFGLEQGVISLPDMAAVLANFPAYLAARTGEISQERARVDGRDEVSDEDMAIGAATAAVSAAMERFGAERVLGTIAAANKTALRRILGAAVAESATEAGQEATEYVGERIGQQPMSLAEGAERAAFGALGGGVGGGAIRTGVELKDKVLGKEQPQSPPAPRVEPSVSDTSSGDTQSGTPAGASVAPATPATPATQGVERFQMQRQRGELLGRQYEVRPLTEQDFQYLVKPGLPKGHANTLAEYQQKHPTVTHLRVERQPGQNEWRFSKAGPLEAVRPDSPVAREVADFETPEAKQWAALDGEKSERVDPDRLDVENDSLLTAIAKLGGISREEAEAQGIDPKNFSHRGHRITLTFRKGGKSLDEMAEALNEFGYPVKDAQGNYNANALLDAIDAELGGKRQRSSQSAMDDEIAKLEEKGRTAQAPAEPVSIDDLLTHYAEYPGAIEDDSDVGSLHEPEYYPPDFDAGAKKLADLTELAEQIDPDATARALNDTQSSDAEFARRMWSIINGENDAVLDDEEVTADLPDDIGEIAAQAGQEQPLEGEGLPEGRPDGRADSEREAPVDDDDVDAGSRPADEADLRAPEPKEERPQDKALEQAIGLKPGDVITTEAGDTWKVVNNNPLNRNKPRKRSIQLEADNGKIATMREDEVALGLLAPQSYTDANTGERKMSAPASIESPAARPEPASSPLPPPQAGQVGATPGERSNENVAEGLDVLGNQLFSRHSGVSVGDKVKTRGSTEGTVRRIFKMKKVPKNGVSQVRAQVQWDDDGTDQFVDIDKLKVVSSGSGKAGAATTDRAEKPSAQILDFQAALDKREEEESDQIINDLAYSRGQQYLKEAEELTLDYQEMRATLPASEHEQGSSEAIQKALDKLNALNPKTVTGRELEDAGYALVQELKRGINLAQDSVDRVNREGRQIRGFTTSKGSKYRIDPQGRTTRDKAARPEHPGDSGPQPTSEATYYVTPGDAMKLGEFQTQGGPRKSIKRTSDGRIAVRYEDGKGAGKFERRTAVNFQDEPGIGLIPVETWKDGTRVHFGNPIDTLDMSRDIDLSSMMDEAAKVEQAAIDAAANEAATSEKNDLPLPTEDQVEAGNYKKGHVRIFGLDVTIETPKGSFRTNYRRKSVEALLKKQVGKRARALIEASIKAYDDGDVLNAVTQLRAAVTVAKDGLDGVGQLKALAKATWIAKMPVHYGYIRRTVGADDEQFDVFIGPHADEDGPVWVVDQATVEGGRFDESKGFVGFYDAEEAVKAYAGSFEGDFGQRMVRNALGWREFPSVAAFREWLDTADTTKPAAEKPAKKAVEKSESPQVDKKPYSGPWGDAERSKAHPSDQRAWWDKEVTSAGHAKLLELAGLKMFPARTKWDVFTAEQKDKLWALKGQELDEREQQLKDGGDDISDEVIDDAIQRMVRLFQGGEKYARQAVWETDSDTELAERVAKRSWGDQGGSALEGGSVEGRQATVTINKGNRTLKINPKGLGQRIRKLFSGDTDKVRPEFFDGWETNLFKARDAANKVGVKWTADSTLEQLVAAVKAKQPSPADQRAEWWAKMPLDVRRQTAGSAGLSNAAGDKAWTEFTSEEKDELWELSHERTVERIREREAADSGPKPWREPSKSAKAKAEEAEQRRAEYFKPGNIVKSYFGHDRVIAYHPPANGNSWNVDVIAVQKQGDEWVDVKGERPRNHQTEPDRGAKPVWMPPQDQGAAATEEPTNAAQPAVQDDAAGAAEVVDNSDLNPGEWLVREGQTNLATFRLGANGEPRSVKYFHDAAANRRVVDDAIAEWKGSRPTEDAGTDAAGVTPEKSKRLAEWVRGHLAQRKAFTWDELFKMANFVFGGTQAQGLYTPKDAYDAVELGVNLYLRSIGLKPAADLKTAQNHIANLEAMLDLIPTQTKRTEEQDEFQQFSTPPHYAYVAAWVADIRSGESVLEPSAGIGGLAVFARNAEAKVTVNELSPRRAALLRQMGFDAVYTENAEQLNNILPASVQPTLVLMNPPFSATAGRQQGRRSTSIGAQHITQALKRLEPGGRLVAIVGEGMADDRPAFAGWWRDIKREYDVRANVGVDGSGYRKYGTTFDNQLLVIDKRPPRGVSVVTGKVKNVAELLPLLEGIRSERSTAETKQSAATPSVEPSSRPAPASRVEEPLGVAGNQLDAVGPSGGRGGARGAVSGSTGTGDARKLPAPSSAVEPKQGDVFADQPAPGPERGVTGGQRAESGEVAQGGGATAPGSAPRSVSSDGGVALEQTEARAGELTGSIFEQYTPQRVKIPGAQPHPGLLVQSSAMASVLPPVVSYTPNLPKEVISKGLLSDAQLEAVVYAGHAHSQLLDSGERKGYFIGDGTGVGKGREISGIILDNMRRGQKKAIWISEKQDLVNDARRDFAGVTGDPNQIFWHGNTKAPDAITAKDGILFSTYATLRSAEKKTGEGKVPKTRLQQIIDWVGPDFDGVIAFDESHNAGNAVTMKGKRGTAEPSKQALAVVELQKALPKARVVYVSATGATELHNLSYVTRLGLWGQNTPFADVRSFIGQVGQGGLAAMELVARDMKQMGVYTARSLSYEGVTYDRLEHPLSDLQREIYDELARAWQDVLAHVETALEKTGGNENRFAKSAAKSAFWGSHQRFFNQVITAMQMPSVLDDVERRMERGEAIVMQLVNTNEAIQERKLASMKEEDDIDDLDMTPRENLIQYIQNSFPVVQYEEFTDESGNTQTRPVTDSEGNVVENKEAVAMRDALLEKLNQIRVPEGPLEMILNHFGTKQVAEVTGRRRRVVRDKDGRNTVEPRSKSAAQADAAQFMADKKRIMVFSDAGGTGFSFHADLTQKNQRKRAHYLIQPGWRANKAVQGFGRTHRTNQASAPEYILVTTDLAAQKRFISSIARRLDQLGALTKGQRDTANQGLFSASDNLESQYAEDAVTQFFVDLARNRIEGLNFDQVTTEMGLDLRDEEGKFSDARVPEVPKFLNRMLSLTRDRQEKVFTEFNARMENMVKIAIANGTYDAGMETLRALNVEVKREEVVHTEPSGAQTKYVELELTRERVLDPFPDFRRMVLPAGAKPIYRRNRKSGRVWVIWEAGSKTTRSGAVEKRYRMTSPSSERAGTATELNFAGTGYEEITEDAARKLWEEENEALGPTYTTTAHLITGAILPIWDRLSGWIRVVRTQSADGRRYLGRLIDPEDLKETLGRLNVDASLRAMTPEETVKRIQAGEVAYLANGWRLFRSTVSNEKRIELSIRGSYLSPAMRAELTAAGAFIEKIGWQERVFIPVGERGTQVLAAITKNRPVVELKDIEKADVQTAALSYISAETAAKQAAFREEVDLKRIREHYTAIASRWKGFKGRVIVRMNEFDIPERYARVFLENDTIGRVQGFFATDTGDIYLLPGNWTEEGVGERLLFHEAEGHLSTRQFFGEEIVPFFNRVFMVDPAGVKRVGYEHGFYDKNGKPTARVNYDPRTARLRSADEYVAQMAETINTDSPRTMQRMWDWLVSHFAEMMRNRGWKTFKPTEAEIRGFLRRAQASLTKGGVDKQELSRRALDRAAALTAERLDKKSPQHQLGLHPSWNSPEPPDSGVTVPFFNWRLPTGDTIIQALQDRHIDTRRVLEAISAASASGVTAEDTDVYLQEELFHGRVAKRVQDFMDEELTPLLREMQSRHVDMYELNRYLHARHAPERNKQIASINPDMPDGGSGMLTEEAEQYMQSLNEAERANLEALAALVDRIIQANRNILISYGLESPATIDIWQQAYEHYVPLNREDMDTGAPGTGQGFSVRGPASKRAMGSEREVSNILASIAQQREKYLVRGEKNRVANALLGLALENPNDEFWKVDAPPMIRYVSPTTGMVESMVDPSYKSHDNVVVARVPTNKGTVVEHVVVFNKDNERALRMSKALKNLDSDQIGVVLGAFAKVTRWFAAINTQYNPIFGMVNLYRDVQEGLLNLTSTPLAGRQAAIAKLVVPALRGIYIETRARRSGERRRSHWADLWEEFQNEGGQTGYRDMFNTGAERAEAIAKEIKKLTKGENLALQGGRAIYNWLSDYNVAMENAVRVATYKVGRDAGLSKRQAASVAKNLTVNFNRKGAWGTQAGALYAFFNASVQGTARIVDTFLGPAGKKIAVGGILVGVIQALMMAAFGFDEDDIPEFIQSSNLILPIPGTDRRYLSLPYPLGFRFLPNIGRIATQYVMSGFREAPRRVTDMIGVLMDNFNPIGNAGLSAQTIAPTATDPIVALSENRDWTGQPIALENRDSLNPTPGHTRVKATASAFSMGVSQVLNWATGGTDYVPGVFSPTPDQIDYLIGQASGGVGRESLKLSQTVQSLYTGEDLPSYKIPLFGRLYGSAADQAGESRTFYNNVRRMNQIRNEIMGRAEDEKEFDSYMEDQPLAGIALDVNRVEKLVSDLRREKRRLKKAGASREEIQEIDTQITEAIAEINRTIADMEKEQ